MTARRMLCLVGLTMAALLVQSGSALGAFSYPLKESWGTFAQGEPRTGAGGVGSIATDADGNVYVASTGTEDISKWTATGQPIPFSALGNPPGSSNSLDGSDNGYGDPDRNLRNNFFFSDTGINTTVDLSVNKVPGPRLGWIAVTESVRGVTYFYDETGAYRGSNTSGRARPITLGSNYSCGVYWDRAGYYYTVGENVVSKWKSVGENVDDDEFIGQLQYLWTKSWNGVADCDVTVDSHGNVYATDSYSLNSEVSKYPVEQFSKRAGDEVEREIISNEAGETAGIDIDENDQLFVNKTDRIIHMDVNGNPEGPAIGEFQVGGNGWGSNGVATYGEYVYALGHFKVWVYGPKKVIPNSTTLKATSVGRTTATLNGEVDPLGGGPITDCHFEYGEFNATYNGKSAECVPGPAGINGKTTVSANISALKSETTYNYRLIVANANGIQPSKEVAFTPRKVVGLETEPPTNVTVTSATLNGSFDPLGEKTKWVFQWGPGNFDNTTPRFRGPRWKEPGRNTSASTSVP